MLDDKIYVQGLLTLRPYRPGHLRPGLSRRPGGRRQARELAAIGISCDAVMRFAERHADLALSRPSGNRSQPQGGTRNDRGHLPPCAGTRAPRLPRSPAIVLVLPLGRHYRTQRLGFLQPRSSGSTSLPFYQQGWPRAPLPATRPGNCWRPSSSSSTIIRAARSGRHGRRERHLHRFRQHQLGRAACRRLGRLQRTFLLAVGGDRRHAPLAAQQQHATVAQNTRDHC